MFKLKTPEDAAADDAFLAALPPGSRGTLTFYPEGTNGPAGYSVATRIVSKRQRRVRNIRTGGKFPGRARRRAQCYTRPNDGFDFDFM